jgi:hypothetical protein
MITNPLKDNFDLDNKDFDKFINVNIIINGLLLIKEEDKYIFLIFFT